MTKSWVGKRDTQSAPGKPSVEKRLEAAVTKALQLANGLVLVGLANGEEQIFSVLHGLPRLRPRRAQARTAQLQLQLHLWRVPGVPRPRLALRSRPRQGHHRLVQAPARRRPWSRLRVAIPAASSSTSPLNATTSISRSPLKICRPSSSTSWSTGRPRAKPRAPVSTAFSTTCATPSTKLAATAIAST